MSLQPSWGFWFGAAFVLPISVQTGKTSYCFCDCRSTCLNQLSPYTAGSMQMSPPNHEAVPWDGDISSCSTVLGQKWQCPALNTYHEKVLPADSPWGTIFSPAPSQKPNFLQQRCSSPSSLWLVVNQVSTRTPRSFLAELLSRWAAPGMYQGFSPGAGLCTSLWQTSQGSCEPSSPTCWCPSGWHHDPLMYQPLLPALCNLQTPAGTLCPSSRSLMKGLSRVGPSTDLWSTPLQSPNPTGLCAAGPVLPLSNPLSAPPAPPAAVCLRGPYGTQGQSLPQHQLLFSHLPAFILIQQVSFPQGRKTDSRL